MNPFFKKRNKEFNLEVIRYLIGKRLSKNSVSNLNESQDPYPLPLALQTTVLRISKGRGVGEYYFDALFSDIDSLAFM